MVAEQLQRMGQGASTRQGAAEPGVVPCEGAPGELLQIDVTYPGLRLLHRDPPVWWVDGFLTDAECDALVTASEGRLAPAHVVGLTESTGKKPTLNSFGYEQGTTRQRTSQTCTVAKTEVRFLMEKLTALTTKPSQHMELPQVGLYRKGQQYAAHYDAVDPLTDIGKKFVENGGQRVCTVLCYLNSLDGTGGCTFFPRLKLRVTPQKGACLVFFPGFLDGRLDTRVLHTGEPAGDQEKFVSQIWIRENGNRRDAVPSKRNAAPSE